MEDNIPRRVSTLLKAPPFIRLQDEAMKKPIYHKETCPNGLVCLQKANNMTYEDILSKKVYECYPQPEDTDILYYNTSYGCDRLREAMAKFLTKYMKAKEPLDPEKIIVTSGLAGALHCIAMATADVGDYYMIPSPCYMRIGLDMNEGAGILPLYVPVFQNGSSFRNALEDAYTKATEEGKKVRGVVISNPDNPTGRVYTKAEIMDVLEMCAGHQLHAVMDEIYALSVFGDVVFESVLSFRDLPDPKRTHFLWSVSKDFSLSGFRTGLIYTENELIIQYLRKGLYIYQSPMLSQITLANFLSNFEWLDNVFFPKCKQDLKKRYHMVAKKLGDMGLTVYPSQAGLYVWANFSKYMKDKTFEAERELDRQILDAGVLLVSGECFFSTEPGWFRIVYSLEEESTNEGLSRLERFLGTQCRSELETVASL